jgi:hypothetical protein
VAIVSAELPDPLIDSGENEAIAPLGSPLRLKFMVEENPPIEVAETV